MNILERERERERERESLKLNESTYSRRKKILFEEVFLFGIFLFGVLGGRELPYVP